MAQLKRALGLWDLVLLNIVAIVGLRWIATASRTGPSSIILWGLAFLLFFIPQALAVIELSTRHPEEGGIYVWTKRAFGDFHGFISGWCYWSNNLIYYPSLLIFTAGNAVYIGGEQYLHLTDSKLFVTVFALAVLWIAIIFNVIGLKTGKWVQNLGAFGTWIPAFTLILLGAIAWWRYGAANSFAGANLLPNLAETDTISFWSTMCFGFAGLELASTMGDEIRNPRKNIPRAIVISGVFITLIYILGTVAMLLALPQSEISIVSGIMQSIQSVVSRVGAPLAIVAFIALLMTLNGLGGAGAWLAGSARIPFVIGIDKYLPEALGKVHPRWGTPYVAILFQGVLSTLFIFMGVFRETSVEAAYRVLLDMVLIVYFVPFVYLFLALIVLRIRERLDVDITTGDVGRSLLALIVLRIKDRGREGVIEVPGGIVGAFITGGLGFAATVISILFAAMPPEDADKTLFLVKVVGGCLAFILFGGLIYLVSSRRGRK